MKKNIITTSLLLLYIFVPLKTSAAWPVFDATQFGKQIVQLAKDSATAINTNIGAVQQTLETVNNTVLIPMRDAMTVVAVMKSSTNIQNMILGALGTDPLLVRNPELYFKNKARESVQASLGNISLQKGIYGDSILSSLVNQARYSYSDNSSKVRMISQSTIPSTMQKKVCAEETLSKLAREDVLAGSRDGTVDEEAYGDRRRELYRALCTGDPNTNPGLAATLNKLGTQRPDIGGWDTWLATISGDNPYTKSVQLQQLINEEANKTAERAKTDYVMGGGIKSMTECKERASTNIFGDPYGEGYGMDGTVVEQAPCVSEEITQTGSVLNDAFKAALRAPEELRLSSFGKGAGSLISTAFTSINLLQGITNAVGSITGSGSGGTSPGYTAVTNTPVGVTYVSNPVQDLANNPEGKRTLTGAPKEQLRSHLSYLGTLESTDRNYLSQISYYQSQLDGMKACFDNLVTGYPEAEGHPRVTEALNFHSSTKISNQQLSSDINQEIAKIATTTNLISSIVTRIDTSNSSEEISNLFSSYQNTVDTYGLPTITTAVNREGEFQNFKGTVEQSLMEGGAVYQYKSDCSSIRQQLDNARGAGA